MEASFRMLAHVQGALQQGRRARVQCNASSMHGTLCSQHMQFGRKSTRARERESTRANKHKSNK